MATPLIRIPQEQGGTLYAFANAARDLTRSYYNPDLNFEFSKFALIKVPAVTVPSLGSTNNYIEFNKLFDASGVSYNDTTANGNANIHFAQTFQNYALNLEQLVLNDDDFDSTILASDAEKIFFKYLNRIGAFEVRTATSQESIGSLSRVIEFDDSVQTGAEYERVIKYLGNIDVSNDKNYKGDVYNEIFINVPSAVGYTPNVLLKSGTYNTNSLQYTPGGFIEGRIGQTHPDVNLNLDSITDDANSEISIDPNEVSRVENALGIDFDPQSYAKIVNDKKLNTLLDYSKRGGDFRFNAILVYYDLYSKSNPGQRSTNLYGVLLLDNWKYDPANTGWYIPELTKYKPNEVTGLNGNAFALKLNVKFNSSLDNVGVENNINDYSTFSMDIFFDTTSALENAAKILAEANHKYNDLSDRFNNLENLMLTTADQSDLAVKIAELELAMQNASLAYSNAGSIMDLISSTNLRVNQLIDGTIPAALQYNTDVIAAGDGVNVDKSTPNKIKLSNTNYGYALNEVYGYNYNTDQVLNKITSSSMLNPQLSASQGIWTRVKKYDNLVRIYLEPETFQSDLNIYLDDSISGFKVGQVIKLVFRNPIANLNNKAIHIYTDKTKGWILKSSILTGELSSSKPYIELICVDEINKTFELDIIR